ncbi:MAG: hypothetical protein FWD61_11535 [Phycisphaerales bacterium]|nr:hypothetical protein [Phycisphaerales bacterium]
MFCKEPGCCEFAQAEDVTVANVLKFYCIEHERTARARGESEKRPDYTTSVFDIERTQSKGEGELPPPKLKRGRGREITIVKPASSPPPPPSPSPAPSLTPAVEPEAIAASTLSPPISKSLDYAVASLAATDYKEKPMGRPFHPRKVRCVDTGEIFDDLAADAKNAGCAKSTLGGALAPASTTHRAGGKTWAWADAGENTTQAVKVDTAAAPRKRTTRPLASVAATVSKMGFLEKIDEAIAVLERRLAGLRDARSILEELET